MKPSVIFNLSSVLFKSYFRASRRGRASLTYSQPRIMLILDLIAFVISVSLLQYILPNLPSELFNLLETMTWQALIGLPIILTSAIIIAGMLFELGQSGGLSSSETVNWLPISPREYVAASALSTTAVYSPLFAIGVGVTLPFALKFSLIYVWPIAVMLSAIAMLLGAFIVEILKAVMNKISVTVYRRSGKFGVASRLVLLIILFAIIQLAFNPYILYSVLGVIVGGVGAIWFIPVIWPSVALMNLVKHEMLLAVIFLALSVIFASFIFQVASSLRLKYWSPSTVSIVIKASTEYIPQKLAPSIFGFRPLEIAIALKEFRALVRRKDMARFLAIPVIIMISFIVPTLLAPSYYSGSASAHALFMAGFIPFMIPLMLSMVSIGQEGKAIINICMLPLSSKVLIKGKLLPVWIISIIATFGAILGFGLIAPMDLPIMISAVIGGLLVIVVIGFFGLGIGARYPDYVIGPRSRYVTFKGFLIGFLAGGVLAIIIYAPLGLFMVSSQGLFQIAGLNLTVMLTITIINGLILSYLAYRYCRSGVENLISNLEV